MWQERRNDGPYMSLAVFAGFAFLCLCVLEPHAQQPPVFRSGVEVVRVDVAVLDEDRRPIRGLTANDFKVLVDGVSQPILSFAAVEAEPPEPRSTPWGDRVFSDVRTNRLHDPRLFVIVMDDASTEADPYQVQTAKAVATEVVRRLGSEDLASVVFTSAYGRRWSQELTHDRTKLLQAIDTFNFGLTGGAGGMMSRRTLRDVLTFLHERPQTRSTVVFISPATDDKMLGVDWGRDGFLTERDLAAASGGLALARVPIYWFDIRGLEAPGLIRRPVGAAPSSAVGPEFSMNNRPYQGPAFVDESGGRSIMRTNAPAAEVPAVFEENRLYYLLGYQPTYPPMDGRFRRVEIQVNRHGVFVYPGARTVRSSKPLRNRSSSEALAGAIAELLPQSGLSLEMTTAIFGAFGEGERMTQTLCVNVRVTRPAPTSPIDETIDLIGAVLTPAGKQVATVKRTATLKLSPTGVESRFELLSRVDIKPGRYIVRYAVSSRTLPATGSVYGDVTVPEIPRDRVSLSDLAVTATPNVKAAPPDEFRSVIPVTPTTQRLFTTEQTVSAFVRVYRAQRLPSDGVAVSVHLADTQGRETQILQRQIASPEFARRGFVDLDVGLPITGLRPGPHLVVVRVDAGPTAVTRELEIVVR